MKQDKQKEFDLGVILTITTDRLLTDFENVYDILNYLTGDEICTHQIPRVMDIAKPYILSLHPKLEGIGINKQYNSFEEAKAFVDEQKKIFGDKLPLKPMSKEDGYIYMDPIEEINKIIPKKVKVFVKRNK